VCMAVIEPLLTLLFALTLDLCLGFNLGAWWVRMELQSRRYKQLKAERDAFKELASEAVTANALSIVRARKAEKALADQWPEVISG
jgi:hypothetical protein